MQGVLPKNTHTPVSDDLTTLKKEREVLNSPAHVLCVVFYVIRKVSNLIFGDALQPVNNQLEHRADSQ